MNAEKISALVGKSFLLVDGYIETDPTALLESPKKSVHLPEVLTLEEVDAIIAAIDLS